MVWHRLVGSGPKKVVAIHGWFFDHRIFEPLIDCLDDKGFSWAFFDISGYGKARDAAGPYSIEQVAHDAIAVADGLGWERFSLVGHSMGGKAAQRAAILAGGRVEALVGIAPVPAPAMGLDRGAPDYFASAATDDAVALQLIAESVGFRLSQAWMERLLGRARGCTTPAVFAAYARSFTGDDLSAGAAGVTAPVLILPGEFDQGVRPDMLAQAMPPLFAQARIEAVPNSGHYPMVEAPAYLANRIERFIGDGQ